MNTSGVSVTLTLTSDPLGLLDAAEGLQRVLRTARAARDPYLHRSPARSEGMQNPLIEWHSAIHLLSSSVEANTAATYTARGLVQ